MSAAASLALIVAIATPGPTADVPSRVFVVERASSSLAVYDLATGELLPRRVEGLGDLRHATMTFSPDLRWGYLATRSGQVTRVDLETLETAGQVFTSTSSIDNAISKDGRLMAVAEYLPGGLTILDATTLEVLARHEARRGAGGAPGPSRVTGVVDAPGHRFACVLIEGAEIWIVDTSRPGMPVTHRVPTSEPEPYDAMITPDGRFYVVVHLHSPRASVLDLERPEAGVRTVSLVDDAAGEERQTPVKLPHVASWAVAGTRCFVPLVGRRRLAVLDRTTWALERSVPLRGHPVYCVRTPDERELWATFSGEADDAYVQVIDAATLETKDMFRVGGRIYHVDFTPDGSRVLVSANAEDALVVLDARSRAVVDRETVRSPSGIFGTWRAARRGL
jgi:protein NirF